jgi:hypothetical protein
MTCELSLIYSMIRILENIFRKEENKWNSLKHY